MNNNKTKTPKMISSVVKAFEIIEFIAHSDQAVGVTEISNKLSYGVSSTYHLLNTLKYHNILEQDNITKKYKLGVKLWKISKIASEQHDISAIFQPYLRKIRELTGETTNLTILDNNEVVYIAQEESNSLVRMFTKTGARAPLYCSGAGKVLLAYQPEDKREEIINSINFKKFTHKTIVDPQALRKELEIIRQRSYSFDNEEREIGVSCIAAPVFESNNKIIAALSISGPIYRFNLANKERWIGDILKIAKEATEYFTNLI